MRFLVVLSMLFATLGVEASLGQETAKPKVVIITTGGTIAGQANAGMIDGATLIAAVPQLDEIAELEVEEISRVGSSLITPDHWLLMAKRINQIFEGDPAVAGVLITHGTDTLDETAFFLNLTIKHKRPVVLVGAMRTSSAISADGPANLLNALRVATSREAIGKGVLVVLNDEISSARDVWKTNNQRLQTFQSPEFGYLGFADPDTVIFYRSPIRPHTTQSTFDVSQIDTLPNVALISDFTGSDGSLIDHVVGQEPDGIVVATFAGGRMSAGGRRAVPEASDAGMPIVIASRVPGGRISGQPIRPSYGVVARDLPPHKARILLMLALTQTSVHQEIQRIFDTY